MVGMEVFEVDELGLELMFDEVEETMPYFLMISTRREDVNLEHQNYL